MHHLAIINTVRFKKLLSIVTDRRHKTPQPTTITIGSSTTNSCSSSGSSSGIVATAHPEEIKTWLSFHEFIRVMILISDAGFPKVFIPLPVASNIPIPSILHQHTPSTHKSHYLPPHLSIFSTFPSNPLFPPFLSPGGQRSTIRRVVTSHATFWHPSTHARHWLYGRK